METHLQQLPGSPGCFMCDNAGSNPRSLGLTLLWDAQTRTVHIPCTPDETWCGFEHVVHGGLTAALLDEAMAWAVKQVSGDWGFTADYHLRYKAPLTPGHSYTAIGRVGDVGRKISASAELLDADGRVVAQAEATFLPVKGRAGVRPS